MLSVCSSWIARAIWRSLAMKLRSRARLQEPRDLHGQGGRARHDAAVGGELQERAAERQRIDAAMAHEAPVLVREQHRQETRIDVGARRRQPPAAFRRGVGPQQPAVAVDHQRRIGEPLAARHRPERRDPDKAHARHHDEHDERHGNAEAQDAPQPPSSSRQTGARRAIAGRCRRSSTSAHRAAVAAVTSTVPEPVRPKRSGRYMSSTNACGCT